MDDLVADRQRNARAGRVRRFEGATDRPDRACGQHRRRGVVRHAVRKPDQTHEHDVSDRGHVSHQAGAHALRAGVDFVFNDDTITYPRSLRGSYAFSSLANFLTGNYSGFTQTFGDPVVSQTNPNVGMYVQDEWRVGIESDAESRPSLRPAVPRADRHRYQQRVAASRVRLVAVGIAGSRRPRQRRVVLRSRAAACGRQRHPVRGQHDRI